MIKSVILVAVLLATAAFGQPSWHGYVVAAGGGGDPAVLGTPESYGATDTTEPHTYPLTLSSGSDRLLVVCVVLQDNGNVYQVNDVKYGGSGGQSLTQLGTDFHHATAHAEQSLWFLNEAGLATVGDGTNDVWIDLNGPINLASVAVFFEGVNQVSTFGTLAQAEGVDGAPTVDVSSASGELAYDCMGTDDQGDTVIPGPMTGSGTEHAQIDETYNNRIWATVATQAGATTATFAWTNSTSTVDVWGHQGVSIK